MDTIRRKNLGLAGNGGRFATHLRGEADVDLLADARAAAEQWSDDDWDNTGADDDSDDLTDEWDAPGPVLGETDDEAARFIKMAEEAAGFWAHHYGRRQGHRMDLDDLVQDTVIEVLDARAKVQANGETLHIERAWVGTIARNVAVHATGTFEKRETRTARKQFQTEVAALEAERGYRLPDSERDEIADRIRQEWPDRRHRPRLGFHHPPTVVEPLATARGLAYQEIAPVTGNVLPEDTYTEAAISSVDGTDDDGDRRAAVRLLWNAYAEHHDLPFVGSGSLSQRRITAVQALVARTDAGVAGVSEAYLAGERSARTDALFAPWGERLGDAEQTRVARLLAENPHGADLWDSALKFANTRNTDQTAPVERRVVARRVRS